MYVSDEVNSRRTDGASGDLTTDEALTQLLSGTGLTYRYAGDNGVSIVPITGRSNSLSSDKERESPKATGEASQQDDTSGEKKAERSFLDRFRLAHVDQGSAAGAAAVAKNSEPATDKDSSGLQEVIVTAQKRSENLMDVPMSLTALSGEELQRSQSYRFEDYVGTVPGLAVVNSFGATGSQLVIRGLTTGALTVNSSVATYLDETPYVIVGGYAASYLSAPNLDTFDMNRIEVLRGPQGTLYGANALGGLLKYVTNAPDPSGFSAAAEMGGSTVQDGVSGFDAHGMVNIPLGSDLAFRLVGYDTYYSGFIDDPSRGVTDINGSHYAGVELRFSINRSAALPSDLTRSIRTVLMVIGAMRMSTLAR